MVQSNIRSIRVMDAEKQQKTNESNDIQIYHATCTNKDAALAFQHQIMICLLLTTFQITVF